MLDLTKTLAGKFLAACEYPWEILPLIKKITVEIGNLLTPEFYIQPYPDVWVAKTATVAPSASVTGPAIIGPGTEIRHCAFIRGNVIIGENCVVGNSTEVKNSIIFDSVQIPHFNYVGDSVLGYKAHFGAGAITSNVKSDRSLIRNTGLKKFGAIVGDYAEIGCNTVLNPGTIIGRNTNIYPCSCVRGTVPSDCIYKNKETIVKKGD